MVSAPPGRSSTSTVWPSSGPSTAASRRAALSVALPAACGTISRIGRSGYSARAAVNVKVTASAAMTKRRMRRVLPNSFDQGCTGACGCHAHPLHRSSPRKRGPAVPNGKAQLDSRLRGNERSMRLLLATRTEERRPALLHDTLHRAAAVQARLTFPVVDLEIVLEVAE